MAKSKKIIVLAFLLFIFIDSKAQTDCEAKEHYKGKFDRIFGGDYLWEFGEDTLLSRDNIYIIYYCELCKLKGIGKDGKLKWVLDLSQHNCKLTLFSFLKYKNGDKLKGYTILLQFKNKLTYVLNPKSGKMKPFIEKQHAKINNKIEISGNRVQE